MSAYPRHPMALRTSCSGLLLLVGCGGVEVLAPILLPMIHFAYASATIRTNSERLLQAVAERMNRVGRRVRLAVEGNADANEGKWLPGIARRRTEAMRDQLVKRGIAPGRLVVVDHGSERPINDNSTDQGRLLNRRVEFRWMADEDP
jgi:outer membrane protein OmpA-like peptidoglycan-associated protein